MYENSERKKKFSFIKLVPILIFIVVAIFVLFFLKNSFSGAEENTVELSRMILSVGNEIDVDLGELNEEDIQEIAYSSKDENVAIINEKGKITAVNNGETDIVVIYKVDDVAYEKNVNVVVLSRSMEDAGVSDEITLDYTFNDGVKENVWTNQNVRITVSSNANVKYAIDCDDECSYTDLLENKAINITTEGEHTVILVAYDENNNSVVEKVKVKIDKIKPICKFVKGPEPDEIYVGESATYVVECVDEDSRLNVVNDIKFLDVVLPEKFTFTNDSIVNVVKEIYEKTKKTAIKVENIDDGYRYILSVTGLKAGKTQLELPREIFTDYAGNVQEKSVSKEITVLDKKDDSSDSKNYLYCTLSYANGVLTGRAISSNGLSYYGFSDTYSGSNETTMSVGKAGTYYYYMKDSSGNVGSCKVIVDKKDLPPTCDLEYVEAKKLLVGSYVDNSGTGMSYYGFSSTYTGEKTTDQYIKKSGTYYFYVKDNNGNTTVCEKTVEVIKEKPTCTLTYNNGVLIGSSVDVNNSGFSYEGFNSNYSGNSEYTRRVDKAGTYYYYVKDNEGLTGSCSTVVTESMLKKVECKLSVDMLSDEYYHIFGSTTDSDGNALAYYGFSSTYSGTNQSTMKITKPGVYTYYVKDKYGNEGSCKIDTTDKPSCSLSFADNGEKDCLYLRVEEREGSKYGAYIVSRGFVNYSASSSYSEIVKVCGKKQYTYSVTDAMGNVGTCSINLEDTPSCELKVEVSDNTMFIKATYKNGSKYNYNISQRGFTKYDYEDKLLIQKSGTYYYYVKDIVGNEGSCSITVDPKMFNKPTCTLTYKDGVLTGNPVDGNGSGIVYYGFSSNVNSPSKSTLDIEKPGTYYFYVKDNLGYIVSCSTKVTAEEMENEESICSSGTYYDNGTCKTCPTGSYCNGSKAIKCPNGYESGFGATKQSDCFIYVAAGEYLSYPTGTSKSKCAKGTYSVARNVNYGESDSCDKCPEGTTTTGTGSIHKSQCSVMVACKSGQYLEGGTCKQCPTEYPNSITGADSISDCYMNVSAGQYVATGKAKTTTSCKAGTYKKAHTVNYGSTSSCSPCPGGYSNSPSGATDVSKCYMNVAAGNYIATGTNTIQTKCKAGTYKSAHTVNYGSTSSCDSCPAGYTSASGATSKGQCYMNVAAGKYIATTDASSAVSCPAGTSKTSHTVYYGETSKCDVCVAGTYSTGGAKSCSMCPTGYTSTSGATAKEQCYITVEAGYYLSVAGGTTKVKCPEGTSKPSHNVNYGSTSNCSTCSEGTYGVNGKCITCPQNSYCTKGVRHDCPSDYPYTTYGGGASKITECYMRVEPGHYVPSSGSGSKPCKSGSYATTTQIVYYGATNTCTACPSGYENSREGASSKSDCYINVPAGKYLVTKSSTQLASCAKGTYKEKHEVNFGSVSSCIKCDSGTTTSGTGATSKSECSLSTCVRDESCGCESYTSGYVYVGTEYISGKCSDDPSSGSTLRCTGYSSSSSGSNCRWTCKKYEYQSYCKQYKCCELNKSEDFEFSFIDFDFINEVINNTLSGLFK